MSAPRIDPAADRLAEAMASLPEVRLAFLFGSRGRGQGRAQSDFDVAVLVDDSLVAESDERARALRRLIGRLGREVSSTHLDMVILNDAPILLSHRVLRDGVLLYERSAEERVRYVTGIIRRYQDGAVRRDWFLGKRIGRLKGSSNDGGPGDLLEKARRAAWLFDQARGVQ